ncbi:APC family permease [Kitasatospora sp. NPDC096147]|uniref:APC family permease n=1 Tax=Kitasatospora sp. NPDC096147 TaxID=3364093 RepID=UPI0037F2650E
MTTRPAHNDRSTVPQPPAPSTGNYRRTLGTVALTATGLGSIIGSGWLFGAANAAAIAGPASILAWVVGAAIAFTIALSYTELGAAFPEAGAMVRFGHYSHGSLTGYLAAWANWIAIVSVIPGEATASIQYMSSWSFDWAQGLFDGKELTGSGLVLAAVLVVFYFGLNWFAVSLFARTNTAITVFKLVVPALTVTALLATSHHTENLTSGGGFAPNGASAVLTAVATSGIVWAFNGFQSPVNLAAEAKNPGRSLPIAVLGSIGIALLVYLGLQTAYLLTVDPATLAAEGWGGLQTTFRSPFADLATALMLNWLALLLFADAFVSPSGTGMTYAATTARMIHGIQRNGHLPGVFGKVDPKSGIPRPAMLLNLAIAFLFLAVFRGWGALAAIVSVATVISYVTGPVAAVALRRIAPELPRPVRLRQLPWLAPLAFVFGTLVLYWARWPLTGQVLLIIGAGLPVYAWYEWRAHRADPAHDLARHLRSGLWLVVYLVAMALVSWLGGTEFGGLGYLAPGWDVLLVALIGFATYRWGLASAWRGPALDEAVAAALTRRQRESEEAPVTPEERVGTV